jgi:hypothetical protein
MKIKTNIIYLNTYEYMKLLLKERKKRDKYNG